MASIDKRPNGGYRARWREHPGGPQQTRQFARKVDAVRFLDGIRGDIAHGLYVDPNGGRTPFQDYAERWRAGQLHRPSTATQAETYLRVHAYPTSPRRHRDRCPRRASGPVSAGRTCTRLHQLTWSPAAAQSVRRHVAQGRPSGRPTRLGDLPRSSALLRVVAHRPRLLGQVRTESTRPPISSRDAGHVQSSLAGQR